MRIGSYIEITQALKIPFFEVKFQTSRSSGPGGQNVNKVETRVELIFNIAHSKSLSESIRQLLLMNLSTYLKSSGTLRIVVQDSRSQWKNKQIAIDKFKNLMRLALKNPQKRITTQPTVTSNEKRLKYKQGRSKIKIMRKPISVEQQYDEDKQIHS